MKVIFKKAPPIERAGLGVLYLHGWGFQLTLWRFYFSVQWWKIQ